MSLLPPTWCCVPEPQHWDDGDPHTPITHRSQHHPTQPSVLTNVSHLRAEVSTIITKQILEKPCTASRLEQNITHISLHWGFQAPLGPLLRHGPSWWGQRDRPTFYSKLATPTAISADQTVLHRKGQEKLESAQRFILEVPTVCGGALNALCRGSSKPGDRLLMGPHATAPRPPCHQSIPPNSPLLQSAVTVLTSSGRLAAALGPRCSLLAPSCCVWKSKEQGW